MALNSYPSNSGLNVWFRNDVQNALRAVESANAGLFEIVSTPEMELYRQGYEAALRAVAEAFGIRHEPLTRPAKEKPVIVDVTPW
ncbi:MAG: hypothetical protein JSV81_06995 [Anaerolineales bacterium]|nr:MAG: hypothetical protein JSV81_06995 [Anaerolineales bacterium]